MKWSILFLFFLTACSSEDPYNYPRIAHSITNKTIIELEKEDKKLRAISNGGGMMGDIYKMNIGFDYFQVLNLEESRKLLILVIETYLKNINESKEIRPYLHEYPYPVKRIDIRIWVRESDGKSPSLGEISLMSSVDGVLTYKLSGYDQYDPRKILLKEPYEEALSILAGNQ